MTEEQHYDHVVEWARYRIGLRGSRFRCHEGEGNGVVAVARCIHCGTLFGTLTHNLGNLDHILKGDCDRPWQHGRARFRWAAQFRL